MFSRYSPALFSVAVCGSCSATADLSTQTMLGSSAAGRHVSGVSGARQQLELMSMARRRILAATYGILEQEALEIREEWGSP